MGAGSSFLLFLVSIFIFSEAGIVEQDKPLATIHVINAMPRDSEPMQIHCNSRNTDHGTHEVRVGDDYKCAVQENALHFCEAISGRQIASWHAFQPRRDGNRQAVFWLVKADGFFLSWDNSTWVKRSEWETE